ncbi:hypothetical protein B0J17DRAFT_630369 [Rhizoctonia solani]|nr:hypothetical protein B0J17DRAFT_630369 [Rhizoctonia solani]
MALFTPQPTSSTDAPTQRSVNTRPDPFHGKCRDVKRVIPSWLARRPYRKDKSSGQGVRHCRRPDITKKSSANTSNLSLSVPTQATSFSDWDTRLKTTYVIVLTLFLAAMVSLWPPISSPPLGLVRDVPHILVLREMEISFADSTHKAERSGWARSTSTGTGVRHREYTSDPTKILVCTYQANPTNMIVVKHARSTTNTTKGGFHHRHFFSSHKRDKLALGHSIEMLACFRT